MFHLATSQSLQLANHGISEAGIDGFVLDKVAPDAEQTILVVEDEEIVRKFIAEVLSGVGYPVLEAGNGAEAIQLGSQIGERIHLLLTDVVMPQIGGPELPAAA